MALPTERKAGRYDRIKSAGIGWVLGVVTMLTVSAVTLSPGASGAAAKFGGVLGWITSIRVDREPEQPSAPVVVEESAVAP